MLKYAIVAKDSNPLYDGFWEYVKLCWNEFIGVTPVLVQIADKFNYEVFDDSIVITLPSVSGVNTGLQAQISRLWVTKFFPNDPCITSDIDMLNFDKEYYQSIACTDSQLVLYSSDVTDDKMYYPMCYIQGYGSMFNRVFHLNCDWEEFVLRLTNQHNHSWFTDELYVANMINAFEHPSSFIKLSRGWSNGIANNRIDRVNIHQNSDPIEYSDIEQYIDFRCPRPLIEWKEFIDVIIQYKLNKKTIQKTSITPIPKIIKNLLKNKVNFVHNIGEDTYTFLYSRLKQLNLLNKKYDTNSLPDECFIYEFQQKWEDEDTKNGIINIDFIPKNVLNRIKQKTAFLIITVPYESPLWNIHNIHTSIKNCGLPKTQIIYLSGCLNGNELYNEYCNTNNIEPVLNFEYNLVENLLDFSLFSKNKTSTYNYSRKKKLFLMFNRRWHPHRTLFLYYIYKMNLIDSFNISFSDNQNEKFEDVLVHHYDRYINDGIIDYDIIEELSNNIPFILDTDDFVTSSLMFDEFDMTKNFYDESFISIIAETYFFTDSFYIQHLTEKTFKPMLYKHPFIMLGPPGMLKKLRELGFKTFHDVWDESYDDTLDHTERFYKVLDLCEKIRQWPQIRKVLAMQKCKSIVEHNFNLLLNYNSNPTLLLDFIKRHKLSPYDD
jgi:hypothetical protein